MQDLSGKVALVTGAAQGLGATFSSALAAAGARVVVGDVANTDATCRAIEAAGGQAIGVPLDVTDPSSVDRFVREANRSFGGVHILVNNAALFGNLALQPFTQIPSDEWDRVMAVNVRGTFECMKAVASVMKVQGYGKIINLASGTAIKGSPGLMHYVASKGAVISMTRAAARELGDSGICVNCISPGLTMSESVRNHEGWHGAIAANNIATRAIKREAEPQDLIGALLFLASAASDFMTGQTLSVDGGSVMN
jgi:NAD(P)-dependent dehydrogenase (short-subunit alcohol dehydrogenase family)